MTSLPQTDPELEPDSDAQPSLVARLSGIEKGYPGVKALKGVNFDIHLGEIHCLVGENGAGKSTLMRVLSGATQPDAGTVTIDGRSVSLDPAMAIDLGIGIVHQELDLIPALSVAENVYLGHEPVTRFGTVDKKALGRDTKALLDKLGLNITPATLVRDLAPAQQQMVQIAKALSHQNRILILDEPTASLTDNETERLFDLLKRLREQNIAQIYISHRLEEVLELGDRLTVFRDGESVLTAPVQGMSRGDIVEAMVGRPVGEQFVRSAHRGEQVALAVKNLSRAHEFKDISFEVREGEVLALAGIVGAGRSELLETLFGIRRPHVGHIVIGGNPVRLSSPRQAIQHGLGLVPEERRESGLVLGRSVGENIVYPTIERFRTALGLNHKKIANTVDKYIGDLAIKTPSSRAKAAGLSGGNQQKIVIGKWLAAGTRILLLDEPTRGVDVNAKAEIYRIIDELAQEGVAVIMASSELPEVLGISDRVLVLAQGRQTALLETRKTSQVEIMQYAVA